MGSPFVPGPQQAGGLLRDSMLVQAGTAAGFEAADLADRDGSGLVLCGDGAITTARAIRDRGFQRPLLIDRRRYAGNSRRFGTERLDPSWMEAQRRLGAPTVLTDSGYISEMNLTALRSVLSQAAEAEEDVTAVLPLHRSWLHNGAELLIPEIRRYGVPVALVLEDRNDPLDTERTLRGLVAVLRSGADVALLCTDMSGLGAICFGAQWAAVGVRSGLRHLYPADASGGAPGSPMPPAFVAPLLDFIGTDRIARAWAASQDCPVWKCSCTVCEEQSIAGLETASAIDVSRHSFECLLNLRDGLASLRTRSLREKSWREKCGHALNRFEELKLEYEVPGLKPPKTLKGWCAV